jgi:hypothetical protein
MWKRVWNIGREVRVRKMSSRVIAGTLCDRGGKENLPLRETGIEIGLGGILCVSFLQPKWHDTKKGCELGAESIK